MGVIEQLAIVQASSRTLDPADPMRTARELISERYSHEDGRLLHHHRGEFFTWNGHCFRPVTNDAMRSEIWKFCETAVQDTRHGLAPFKPIGSNITNIVDALAGITHLSGTVSPPIFLDDHTPADKIVVCANGILYLPEQEIYPSSPALFATTALNVPFDKNAPRPRHWPKFLNQLWPGDKESIDTLQEIFGYMLTPDTRQQKIFTLIGPPRSGKGTIARVLNAILGPDITCAPTLAGLGANFGLQPLIGKHAAIIADARLSGRADQIVVAERLLSISGEDNLTIDRKHLSAWTGKMSVRFVLLSNEIPRIADASGALANRFIMLQLKQSFLGKEDPNLTTKLLEELPGILRWAVEGWKRLNRRGHFKQPASAREIFEELEDLGSPISVFVREECHIGRLCSVSIDELFTCWQGWCKNNGIDFPGTKSSFGRNLRAAVPGLSVSQPRQGGVQRRVYKGIELADHWRTALSDTQ